jgi:mannose-6-phosphate isomerase-like protein (cupin superfamily)
MKIEMVEKIFHNEVLLAIIIRNGYHKEGVSFFTPDEFSQQIAYMSHKRGKVIQPHIHNSVKREVHFTKEVLIIKKGRIRIDFYSNNQDYLSSRILLEGDVILLSEGGHGFKIIDDIEMIEVKQGPYAGDMDKTRFPGADESDLIIK